jgi:hypothetical protein
MWNHPVLVVGVRVGVIDSIALRRVPPSVPLMH